MGRSINSPSNWSRPWQMREFAGPGTKRRIISAMEEREGKRAKYKVMEGPSSKGEGRPLPADTRHFLSQSRRHQWRYKELLKRELLLLLLRCPALFGLVSLSIMISKATSGPRRRRRPLLATERNVFRRERDGAREMEREIVSPQPNRG